MPITRRARRTQRILVAVLAVLATLATLVVHAAERQVEPVHPRYDPDGRLLLPDGYTRWILAGSSLGLSYGEGMAGHEMYHFTLIEPTAWEHFRTTGEFREGTMLALLLHDVDSGALPARRGRYAGRVTAVEMAVKDSSRNEGGWGYYNFAGDGGLTSSARAMPRRSCQACHTEHAAHDNVFLQFYPLLVDAAPAGTLPAGLGGAFRPAQPVAAAPVTAAPSSGTAAARTGDDAEPATPPAARLALGGLDPVHLVEGRREMGKPEIVAEHRGLRYQFLSEPSRRQFAQDPSRFAIQNESCPVVPGAPLDPALFAVHEAKIYAFATTECVAQFEADPEAYVKP